MAVTWWTSGKNWVFSRRLSILTRKAQPTASNTRIRRPAISKRDIRKTTHQALKKQNRLGTITTIQGTIDPKKPRKETHLKVSNL